jgi:hypothetical protein
MESANPEGAAPDLEAAGARSTAVGPYSPCSRHLHNSIHSGVWTAPVIHYANGP